VEENKPVQLSIPLLGHHQVENAVTAYAALKEFQAPAIKIDDFSIRLGFSKTVWPGRFEILQEQPLLVVDCAHNRDSALKLRTTVQEYFPDRPVVLIFGASEDKDIQGMLAELMPIVDSVIVTRSFHPRAAEPEQVADVARQFGKPVKIIPVVADALKEAFQDTINDRMILATGSIFIVASTREAWFALRDDVTALM
jgi:dihydrofolate synthase / folylpolyglutamate synthase